MASIATAALVAFDLVCHGMMTGYQDKGGKASSKPSTMSFRVDLAKGRWCDGTECSSTQPLVRVTPTEIWFQDFAKNSMAVTSVANRETGQLRYSMNIMGMGVEFSGSCEKQRFSGFPLRKF